MVSFNPLQASHGLVADDVRLRQASTSQASFRPTTSLAGPRLLARPWAHLAKRGFDIVSAASLLVLLSPLMIVAMLNVRRDGGPALYQQDRVGLAGRTFRCLKLRSMHVDADQLLADLLTTDPTAATEWEVAHKLRHDPRVTRIGHFIRTTSIDELPQLINVLRGEMSLVGPRPLVPPELRRYGRDAQLLTMVKPGLTGLWQVSGRSDTTYQERVKLDCDYVREWTLWLDIIIVLRTIPVILMRRGAI